MKIRKLVIFNWKYCLYDPDKKELYRDCKDIVERLGNAGYEVALRARVRNPTRFTKWIEKQTIYNDFDSILAYQSYLDNDRMYWKLVKHRKVHPENTTVVDCNLSALISPFKMGSNTVWVKRNPVMPISKNFEPDHTVKDLWIFEQRVLV